MINKNHEELKTEHIKVLKELGALKFEMACLKDENKKLKRM